MSACGGVVWGCCWLLGGCPLLVLFPSVPPLLAGGTNEGRGGCLLALVLCGVVGGWFAAAPCLFLAVRAPPADWWGRRGPVWCLLGWVLCGVGGGRWAAAPFGLFAPLLVFCCSCHPCQLAGVGRVAAGFGAVWACWWLFGRCPFCFLSRRVAVCCLAALLSFALSPCQPAGTPGEGATVCLLSAYLLPPAPSFLRPCNLYVPLVCLIICAPLCPFLRLCPW